MKHMLGIRAWRYFGVAESGSGAFPHSIPEGRFCRPSHVLISGRSGGLIAVGRAARAAGARGEDLLGSMDSAAWSELGTLRDGPVVFSGRSSKLGFPRSGYRVLLT